MIASKFGIGQQVRHSLLGYLGVVVDIDPVYSLSEPSPDELAVNDELRAAPWYHVVMEDDNGLPVHTYLAEAQLSSGDFLFGQAQARDLNSRAAIHHHI